jgi:hypothetical protein
MEDEDLAVDHRLSIEGLGSFGEVARELLARRDLLEQPPSLPAKRAPSDPTG